MTFLSQNLKFSSIDVVFFFLLKLTYLKIWNFLYQNLNSWDEFFFYFFSKIESFYPKIFTFSHNFDFVLKFWLFNLKILTLILKIFSLYPIMLPLPFNFNLIISKFWLNHVNLFLFISQNFVFLLLILRLPLILTQLSKNY